MRGRALGPEDLFALPPQSSAASFDAYYALLRRRRSVREFMPAEVEPELVERILDAARTAPTGVPPSDVNVLVLDSREKNRAFTSDFCAHLKTLGWLTAPWFLALMPASKGTGCERGITLCNGASPASVWLQYGALGAGFVFFSATCSMPSWNTGKTARFFWSI